MTLRLSTNLRNKMLGLANPDVALICADTIAFVDGGAGDDTITDSGNGFVTAGFKVGDSLYIEGTTNNECTDGSYVVTGVAAGTLTLATDTTTTEAAGTVFAIAAGKGGSLADVMQNGYIMVYSGSQPANADTAHGSTELVKITVDSGAWVAGAEANGLEFQVSASGEIEKNSDTWSGVGLYAATAGWFRFYANASDAGGASTILPRFDGTVGTSGADLNMSSTTITVSSTYTIDSFKLTLPYQYGA